MAHSITTPIPAAILRFGWPLAVAMGPIQEGKLKVLVDKVFPLAEAREALRVIEDREVFGKVVVSP